ncbi:hypothetical protein Tco_1109040 [Tanacetum coccineum]
MFTEPFAYLPLPLLVKLMADSILYLADLAPLLKGSPLHLTIIVGGHEMTLRDFLQYLRNHLIPVAAVPLSVAVSRRNSDDPPIEASERDMEAHLSLHGTASVVTPIGLSSKEFISPLATSEENSDSDSFLPGDDAVHEDRDVLSKLDHHEVQRWLDGLSVVELANFHDVSALKFGEQSVSSTTIAQLEAELLSIGGGSSVIDFVVVHDLMSENERRCHKFDEKEAIMLATKASPKAEIESLKEKLDYAVEDRSLMVTDLLPHAVKVLLSSDSFSTLLLKDLKDYEPNDVDSFDKSVNNFYRVKFPYLDLLAYYARKSLGLLKSLEPPYLPPRAPSGSGTSSSPFL